MWHRPVRLAVTVALAATAATLLGAIGSGRLAPADRARAASFGRSMVVTVGAPIHARPLASGFMGLSLEYRAIEEYGGHDPRRINPLFVRLVRELSPGEPPQLRIGGDSTDRAWWPARGVHKPLGAYIRLNARWGAVARALVRSTGARVTLGIDLEADSGAPARVEATRLVSAIGRHWVQALELGNEPELYSAFTWYHVHGRKMPGRPRGWNSPSTCGSSRGSPARSLVSRWRVPRQAREMDGVRRSVHCRRAAGPDRHASPLSAPELLRGTPRPQIPDDRASVHTGVHEADSPTASRADIALAHAHGLQVRIDEVNTISCGRSPAVDESFASALWVLQTLFAFARTGADGVNIHTYAGSPYALFKFHDDHGEWSAVAYPEYYGMRMFAQAAPAGSDCCQSPAPSEQECTRGPPAHPGAKSGWS